MCIRDRPDGVVGAGTHTGQTNADRRDRYRAGDAEPHVTLGPGDVVAGRYELIRMLGGGQGGRVYVAFDRHLGREVALRFVEACDRAVSAGLLAGVRRLAAVPPDPLPAVPVRSARPTAGGAGIGDRASRLRAGPELHLGAADQRAHPRTRGHHHDPDDHHDEPNVDDHHDGTARARGADDTDRSRGSDDHRDRPRRHRAGQPGDRHAGTAPAACAGPDPCADGPGTSHHGASAVVPR